MTGITPLSILRSVLIAPSVREDFISKLPGRGADVVFLDCEDAVPANAKERGRELARRWVPWLVAEGATVVVRVNAVTGPWFDADIREGVAPEAAAVVVPKIETVEQLDHVAATLDRAGLDNVGVLVGIETALGVLDARILLSHPRVSAAYFGAEDLIADLGGVRTESNHEVAGARSAVALAARVAEVPIVDQVVTDFRNEARFTSEAQQARNMGYAGKLCIHPGQVEPANAAFTPGPEEADRARRLLAAYAEAQDRGLAAIDFEGQMVDEPLAVQARRLLERVQGVAHP
jgi:citrate lyase subunit beta/citryl-CoA lyase